MNSRELKVLADSMQKIKARKNLELLAISEYHCVSKKRREEIFYSFSKNANDRKVTEIDELIPTISRQIYGK